MTYPALMRKQTAAAYVDMSLAGFDRQVACGIFPEPTMLDKKEFWSKSKIDRALGVLSGDVEPQYADMPIYENSSR